MADKIVSVNLFIILYNKLMVFPLVKEVLKICNYILNKLEYLKVLENIRSLV